MLVNVSPSLRLGDIKVRWDARLSHRAFTCVICPLLWIYVILLRLTSLDSVYSCHVLLKHTQTPQHMTGFSNKGKRAINTARDHVTGIVQMNWYSTYSGRDALQCFHSQAVRGDAWCMATIITSHHHAAHTPLSSLSQQPAAASSPSSSREDGYEAGPTRL